MSKLTSDAAPNILPVILAGGSGTRLWPLSRKHYAKQYLALDGTTTMLQSTVARISALPCASPFVICNEETRFLAAEQMRQIGQDKALILLEPAGRNTAPAIALAALEALVNGDDPVLLVMPADHKINDPDAFSAAVEVALPLALLDCLVTFGITPTRPEPGYGYIRSGIKISDSDAFKIDAFVEEALQDSALGTLDFWVYDQVDTGASKLLYFRENKKDEAAVSYLSVLITDSDLAFEMTLNRHGRSWLFGFKPSAHFLNEVSSGKAWIVLTAGIILTCFMVSVLHRRERYTQMIEQNSQLLAQEKNESEQRYLHLFESNNDALFVVEINEEAGPGKFIDVNEAMCHRLGYSKEELLQMSPVDINIAGMEMELQACVAHVLEHKSHLFETVHVTKDGRKISVEINIRALDGSNESLFIGCARDVTQRRKAHAAQIEAREWEMEKLSSALEQTADSIMITDRHGVIEYVNPAFEEITGFSRAEASGKKPTIIKSGRNTSEEYAQLWQTIMQGDVYRNVLINRKKMALFIMKRKPFHHLKIVMAILLTLSLQVRISLSACRRRSVYIISLTMIF